MRALPGGHSFFLKKKNQKKQFLSNDPLKNFDFGIFFKNRFEIRIFSTDCTEIIRNN